MQMIAPDSRTVPTSRATHFPGAAGSNLRTRVSRAFAVALTAAALLCGVSTRAENAGLRLMPLGDSITRGYRSSTDDGYRGPLYNALKNRGLALDVVGSQRTGVMFDPDHEGFNGFWIDQIAERMDAALATCHPNLIALHIGTNDLGQNYQVPDAPKRLAALIDTIIADDPKVTILVAQLVCNATPATQSLINAFNAIKSPRSSSRVPKRASMFTCWV